MSNTVLGSIRDLITGSANSLSLGVKMLHTGLEAGQEATERWKEDRSQSLEAAAYSRRLNLLERVKEDARRASQQGIDPTKVMSLSFTDCLAVAVKDLETRAQIKFEPFD